MKYQDKKELLLHLDSNYAESRVFSKMQRAIDVKVWIFSARTDPLEKLFARFLQLETNDRECFQSLKKSIYTSGGLSDKYKNHDKLRDTGFRRRESGKSIEIDSFTLRLKGVVVNKYQSDRQIRKRIKSLLSGSVEREDDLLTSGSGR